MRWAHRHAGFPQLRRDAHPLPLVALAVGRDQDVRCRRTDEAARGLCLRLHLILHLQQATQIQWCGHEMRAVYEGICRTMTLRAEARVVPRTVTFNAGLHHESPPAGS